MASKTGEPISASQISRITAIICFVVIAIVAPFAILWLALPGVVAVAVGILLAVFLDGGARGLGFFLPWPRKVRLAIVLLLIALLCAAVATLGGTLLLKEARNFVEGVKPVLKQADDFLSQGAFGLLPNSLDLKDLMPSGGAVFGSAKTITAAMFEWGSIIFAIVFLGIFLAWEPAIYKSIVLSLLPKAERPRVNDVMDKAAEAIREWLVGQSISMLVIFLFSLVALLVVDMPFPILLSVQAGLLTFIPTIGPFAAGVVIILAGYSQSGHMALLGLGTYLMIQFLETHLITPLVQQRTVRLPPAATLGAQLLASFIFGLMGVAFIVPLCAAGKVFIRELYVEDRLGGTWPVEQKESSIMRRLDRLIAKIRG